MKRINIILMAFAFVLTMTQCKKNEETTLNEVVTITLDVKHDNGAKVDVDPTIGTVDFETGDKVYVGSGGKYVGFLTHNGTNFVGNITNPTENQPLQFYFLGNVTPNETLTAGTTEECSVIISDQTKRLPVISTAASNENYISGVTAYTGHLLNKCALVKFNVTTPSNSPICITGMKNKVTVDFSQNTMTPGIDGEGVIKLPAGSGENVEKWAILLAQEALGEGEEGSAYSEDGVFLGTRPAVCTIVENGYLAEGTSVYVNLRIFPEGAINGLFTINENGDKVYFSKGNLQYIGDADIPYWKFADNQWECFGTTTEQNSEEENVNRDLFGWGTSGHDHGAVCFQPWSASTPTYNYYAYGSPTKHLYYEPRTADWGYNRINNGGNEINSWRTLTKNEWDFVINTRSTITGIRFAKAQVNNVNGVILLPDDWEENTFNLSNTNNVDALYSSNTITESQWSVIEDNGAVFLPAAGRRYGTSIGGVNDFGHYFSSSVNVNSSSNYAYAYGVIFDNSRLVMSEITRSNGSSVRLVQDYQP